MCDLKKDLEGIIGELREEFAEIRREIQDPKLDIDAFGNYKENLDLYTRDENLKKMKLERREPLKQEVLSVISQRTEVLRDRFCAYKQEIDRVNSTQEELKLSIEFKGNKKGFLAQLKEQFRGTGINESRYADIVNEFSDMLALIEDVLFREGLRLKPLITDNQYASVLEKIKTNYADMVELETTDMVEIKYHGKALNRHSTGQRASALALFILAQNDNDIIIIDQPEDDLDNQVIYSEFIKRIKEKKISTQFIFATHNANIPVLGDAERIVAASFTDIDLNMNMSLGSIDSIESQRQIVTIMEGGQEAFKRRNEIYSSWGK